MLIIRRALDGLGKTTPGFSTGSDSLTVQSQRDEADINVLVKRFGVTGVVPQSVRVPSFGDFTGVNDYRTALDALNLARDSFRQMPSDVRARFHNDPARFVLFCSDSKNLDEMRKLGLAVPEKEKPDDIEREIRRRRRRIDAELDREAAIAALKQ